ncbi:membrane progestin receptor alpha-B-like [Salarias fasciatus]|uniref:Membrane progestin receptor alpha-B-like n=1 Tax=Salarias fasciatus TaxID=181472 RepID=A0A672GJS0_SALFA|nr:membrane progestin receptor alpha-B-like [Salarias fasciatus]
MVTIVMERIGRLFISLQQIRQVPRMLAEAAPSVPSTLRDTEVPSEFRERYICSGYRPLHQPWRYYFLSLFRCHNETVNVWTHLLAFCVFLAKLRQISESVDFLDDRHSWPLLILIVSSLIYSACSVAAHLLGGKSELCHYCFFFLDYVGVGQCQYGSAVVHFYYAMDETMYGYVGGAFMPVAALLCCLSCLGCCYGKHRAHSPTPAWVCKMCQVVPSALAYFWDSSPVNSRLLAWSGDDPVKVYYLGQVLLFLSAAFFFTFPLPQCVLPGRCDFMGHNHQIFHVLLSCCTLCQIHTYQLELAVRRELYSRLHGGGDPALLVALYVFTLAACSLIAAFMFLKVKQGFDRKAKFK